MNVNKWIISHTGGQPFYSFFYTSYISVDFAHQEIFHAKISKLWYKKINDFFPVDINRQLSSSDNLS